MRKIILASNNQHKIKEFREMFSDAEILSLSDVWFDNDIVEDWETFLENALIKCRTICEFLKWKWIDGNIIADDSGLCVNALNWEPWVYSARYGWWHWNDAANRAKLLKNLEWKSDRSAYIVCCLVEMFPDWNYIYSEWKTYWTILQPMKKKIAFHIDEELSLVYLKKKKMIDNFEKLDRKIRDKKVWKQDEIFETIWNDKIDNFFENYKQFDEFLLSKSNKVFEFSGRLFLDSEVSEKLHSDFYETFLNSINNLIWDEEIFRRLWLAYYDKKDYELSTREKMYDSDPFVDDEFSSILLWDVTIAHIIRRRTDFNNIEFHYIIYPNRIFRFINKLCKENNLKI